MLASHPDIFISEPKEPHFFAKDEVYALGIEWYQSLFKGQKTQQQLAKAVLAIPCTLCFQCPQRVSRGIYRMPS
jgi:hypothetical protein